MLCARHTARFVAVNCGGIQHSLFESHFFGHRKGAFTGAERHKPGYFAEAEGGTLFLDEVGELPISMQISLLRVLNDGTYTPVGADAEQQADVRIIAATHQNLRELVRAGKVREDFFHRLHVIALDMPPLSQRREDIPLLIQHFLRQHTLPGEALPTIPASLLKRFLAYNWPGNVRELYNELRRYLTTGEVELGNVQHSEPTTIEQPELPFLRDDLHLSEAVDTFEQFYISRALKQSRGKKTKAAARLGISHKTLYEKLKKLGL